MRIECGVGGGNNNELWQNDNNRNSICLVNQADGTFVTKSRLIFTPNRFDNLRHVTCQANNEVTATLRQNPIQQSQQLHVHCNSFFTSII